MVGRRGGDHVRVEIVSRERPAANDYYDGNWLRCRVSVRAGAFSGRYPAALRVEEFVGFLGGVRRLHETLAGDAVFATMEEQLRIAISRTDSLAALRATGVALDQPGVGNRLTFELAEFGQTELVGLIADLERATDAFQVRGGASE